MRESFVKEFRSTARLVTIPLSHYCERARWALDLAGIEYREEPHVPLFHRLATSRAGGRTVPVLVVGREVIEDSASIVRWVNERVPEVGLLPNDPDERRTAIECERFIERELGPHVRRWAYGHLLQQYQLLKPCFTRGAPVIERLLAPVAVRLTLPLIRRAYRIQPDRARESLRRATVALEEVGRRLTTSRRYLVTDQLSVAELTLGALAAPLVFPAGYGGVLPPFEALPAAMRAEVETARATPAGEFVLRLYERDRGPATGLRSAGMRQRV
jgi:glutathione S-transferase